MHSFSRARSGLNSIWQHRKILVATTTIELRRRYAGTFLGPVWLIIYPALFLGVYMFLYMVVFKVRFPDLSEFSYVVLVFSGLVPYLALMETAAFSTSVIRQNIHLVKNVMLPIDLIPARVAFIAICAQIPGLLILIILTAIDGSLSTKILVLPLIMILEMVFLLGVAFHLAAYGGLLPDLQSAINIILIFFLFISPIAFPRQHAPESAQLLLSLNPVTHLIEVFRSVFLDYQPFSWSSLFWFMAGSIALLLSGITVFGRYKAYIVDHE